MKLKEALGSKRNWIIILQTVLLVIEKLGKH